MIALVALHLVAGLVCITWGRRLGRTGLLIGVVGPVATTAWLAWQLPGIVDGDVLTERCAGCRRSASTSTCGSTGSRR